ncbi:hypothetical protein GEMRC1_011870 [Eukaryota sp. GEM-RC1]
MDSSPPSLNSVPPSMSRNCFPDSDHFVIGTTYGLSQNLGNKLTSSKQLEIYFKDIEDVTVNLLSAICSEHFQEVANTESKHPHPQSIVSVSFSSGKSWTSLLEDNELQARVKRWKYPKNPQQRKLVAFSVRCCADSIDSDMYKEHVALLSKQKLRTISVDDLKAKNSDWEAYNQDSWQQWSDLYSENDKISAIGIPTELEDDFYLVNRSSDDDNDDLQSELTAQEISRDLIQLKQNINELIDCKLVEINRLLAPRLKKNRRRSRGCHGLTNDVQQQFNRAKRSHVEDGSHIARDH